MTVENQDDIDGLMRIGRIVAQTLQKMLDAIEPGMTTAELDLIGRDFLALHGARSAPQLTYNFPGATCISINNEAAHGIPGPKKFQPGDVVNVDVSAELGGYFADTGGTRVVPPTSPLKSKLCLATRTALAEAMKEAKAGAPLNRIGKAIERTAKRFHFKVIKNLGSHGVGRALHEEPGDIPGHFDPKDQRLLHNGLVITIEPFLSTKSSFVQETSDGWTLVGAPDNLSAQYEHTMIITRGAPIIVTAVG